MAANHPARFFSIASTLSCSFFNSASASGAAPLAAVAFFASDEAAVEPAAAGFPALVDSTVGFIVSQAALYSPMLTTTCCSAGSPLGRTCRRMVGDGPGDGAAACVPLPASVAPLPVPGSLVL